MTPALISKKRPAFLATSLSMLIAAGFLTAPQAMAKSDDEANSTTSTTTSQSAAEFGIEEDKAHPVERKEIDNLLTNLETVWNRHELEAVMANYSDEYINNDGIDKATVRKLTQEFWTTYPDVHSSSATKHIRIDGSYATVDSRDVATGNTAKEFQSIRDKGELQSLSEGQLYLKRFGNNWRIIGDRIDFEKVKVAFGLAKQLSASFTAPEQIRSGKSFTARLEVSLPPGLNAVGSISNQPLKYPQISPPDMPRVLDSATLERVMNANIENCNELLTARVLLTNPARDKVLGVSVFTRRLNVVPEIRPENVVGHNTVEKTEVKPTPTAAPGELPKADGTKETTLKEIIKKKEEPGADHPPDVELKKEQTPDGANKIDITPDARNK